MHGCSLGFVVFGSAHACSFWRQTPCYECFLIIFLIIQVPDEPESIVECTGRKSVEVVFWRPVFYRVWLSEASVLVNTTGNWMENFGILGLLSPRSRSQLFILLSNEMMLDLHML